MKNLPTVAPLDNVTFRTKRGHRYEGSMLINQEREIYVLGTSLDAPGGPQVGCFIFSEEAVDIPSFAMIEVMGNIY